MVLKIEKGSSRVGKLCIFGWIFPILGLILYQITFTSIIGAKITRILGFTTAGNALICIGIVFIMVYILLRKKIVRLIAATANIIIFAILFILMATVNFRGYRLLFGINFWGTIFSIHILRTESIQFLKMCWENRNNHSTTPFRLSHRLVVKHQWAAIGILFLIFFTGIALITTPKWNLQTHEFQIMQEQAQKTDLVFYYASDTAAYTDYKELIDVARNYDVTLSLAWHIQYYNDTTPGTLGYEMAEFIREANTKDVKIEIFPCFHFNWEGILEGYYFNAAEITLTWYEYWTLFTNWLVRENCTLDYILWDMEGGTSPSDTEGMAYSSPNTQIIGLNQRERELPLIRAEFDRILEETEDLNAITRITTWDPADALDGDHDKYLFLGQFGYVFEDLIEDGLIEYVSTMSYTNGWGNIEPKNANGRQLVYENARMLSNLHPDQVGICIGNINGNGLTTIEEVVNEYHLAIAGGATSVRLFNGASWVLGWDYEVVGPVWGVNGSQDLFEACRQGGTARYTENYHWIQLKQADLNWDMLLNLVKV